MAITERAAQQAYWKEHSGTTVEAMMLDSQAAALDTLERPEVLGMLPTLEGAAVVELGAGIGRFTGALAQGGAAHVLALDFMPHLIEENRKLNGHYPNIEFACADATEPGLPVGSASVDLVFSNWLLMYLSDGEVEALGGRALRWLRPGGHLFFRESCFHQSGDRKRASNPTHYRNPAFYTKLFGGLSWEDDSGATWRFHLRACKCIGAYVRSKKNQNQICWLYQKVREQPGADMWRAPEAGWAAEPDPPRGVPPPPSCQLAAADLLAKHCLGKSKKVMGVLARRLGAAPGRRVLDVHCGVGTAALHVALHHDAHVTGIDPSVHIISVALEHSVGLQCAVEFELGACADKTFPPATFDAIYALGMSGIQNEPGVAEKVFEWLRPGGVLVLGASLPPGGVADGRLPPLPASALAFEDVEVEDLTGALVEAVEEELSQESTCPGLTEEECKLAARSWREKLPQYDHGALAWAVIAMRKPVA